MAKVLSALGEPDSIEIPPSLSWRFAFVRKPKHRLIQFCCRDFDKVLRDLEIL